MKNIFRNILIVIASLSLLLIISFKVNFENENNRLKNSSELKEELIKTDEEFSEKSVNEGIAAAFIAYTDDDVVLMRDKHFPISGKKELIKYYSNIKNEGDKLEWHPVKAEIAKSGELGYTFGNWKYTPKNNTNITFGNYVTIWKKQKEGDWKFVLDGGNTTPAPNKVQMKKLE